MNRLCLAVTTAILMTAGSVAMAGPDGCNWSKTQKQAQTVIPPAPPIAGS